MTDFHAQIAPFYWVESENAYSVCMSDVCRYQQFIFDSRQKDGFRGDGYDWQSLAMQFLQDEYAHLEYAIRTDADTDRFCIYSDDKDALQTFVLALKQTCENETLILDLLSRADLNSI